MLLIKIPFAFLYLLGSCFRNVVFCDLGGKVKSFRPKVVKDSLPNSRKFVTFSIPREPKSKSVSTKSRMSNGSSDIIFLFLTCSPTPSQLHANRVSSL